MSVAEIEGGISRLKYAATVGILTLSFWSSGVFLIRALHSYDLWNSPVFLGILFTLSVPLVSLSIQSVRRILSSPSYGGESIVYNTLQYVLILHGLALGFIPNLYSFTPSGEISASAWLLWFGGIALALVRYRANP